ncbi:MAG: site-2 protease family protein [Firmicutes bacterium]|nr:site-2 protease family protein [Bacillota bacterium]
MFHLDPIKILLTLPGIILGLALHSFVQAYAADRLGDITPRDEGRLTLEPLPHIDVIGLILFILAGFGWAKPVEVNRYNFKNPRQDSIMVSLSGPMANFALTLFSFIVLKILHFFGLFDAIHHTIANGIWHIIIYTARVNLVLFLFNLLPIYPLDGYHLFFHMMPYDNRLKFHRLQRFSRIILVIMIVIPIPHQTIAQYLFDPIVSSVFSGLFALFRF